MRFKFGIYLWEICDLWLMEIEKWFEIFFMWKCSLGIIEEYLFPWGRDEEDKKRKRRIKKEKKKELGKSFERVSWENDKFGRVICWLENFMEAPPFKLSIFMSLYISDLLGFSGLDGFVSYYFDGIISGLNSKITIWSNIYTLYINCAGANMDILH